MDTFLLVDGHNLLFQMFYGMPARIVNARGEAYQGTLGFVGALLRIMGMTKPTHAVVIFDGEQENPRAAIDPDYKANRAFDERDTPFGQLPDVKRALDFLGIRHTETVGCETDDVIASYALALGSSANVVIVSQDSDYFQLISKTVRVLRYRGQHSVICDPAFVLEKYHVEPSRYAEAKALFGDASDNLRGVPGIGPKTAAKLLCEFGSLEAIFEDPDRIPRPTQRQAIVDCADRVRRNLTMIRLDGSAPLPFLPETLAIEPPNVTTNDVLDGIGIR